MSKFKYYIRWARWFFSGTHDWNNPPNRIWKDNSGEWIGPSMSCHEYNKWFGLRDN